MQLMADGVAVVGSRHGILVDPLSKSCRLIRFDDFNSLKKVHLRAGLRIAGKEYVLPLSPDGESFRFLDQRTSPCTVTLTGILASAALKFKLTLAAPFRPRDAAFSTTPVLMLKLEVSKFSGAFRWEPPTISDTSAELFLEVVNAPDNRDLAASPASDSDAVDLHWTSKRVLTLPIPNEHAKHTPQQLPQHDRLVALAGERRGTQFVLPVDLASPQPLEVAWCTWSPEALEVHQTMRPFKYAAKFADLSAVTAWARKSGRSILANAAKVDTLVAANDLGLAANHLLAYTLHAWMICTWWAGPVKGDKSARADWFSVWEGNCHFHSTVDVEFTQAPFYLALWPELLGLELDQWPAFARDGKECLGDRGENTLFLAHDCGGWGSANGPVYPHHMEVEETGNYIILAYCHWRRTGDDSLLRKHQDTLARFLNFLFASASTGDGVPDHGVANTIDDASPAVQFGRKQVYLASKVLQAYVTGERIAAHLGDKTLAKICKTAAATVRKTIESKGWDGDHYRVLTEPGGKIIDPWTKKETNTKQIPGWNASHIYTENGLAILDMVGVDIGLNKQRIAQDLAVAAERCLREYGCIHSDYTADLAGKKVQAGLAGASRNPGWIAMNLYRDLAALYRGLDLRHLAERYWDWQLTTNTQEVKMFFETFNGNNLCFYPRGVVAWGLFDAVAGRVIDKVGKVDKSTPKFPSLKAPRLLDAQWK